MIGRSLPDQPELWFGAILLLPKGASALIDVGWTLAYEVYFYAIFALLIALRIPLFPRVFCLGVFFVLSIALGIFWKPADDTVFGLPRLMTNGLLLEFAAGAFLGWAATRRFATPTWLGGFLVGAAILGFGLSLAIGYETFPVVVLWGVPSVLLVAGVVILENNGWGAKAFRFLSQLGDSSYALYLIHAVLIPVITHYSPSYSDLSYPVFMGLVALLLAFNLAISHAYYLRVETRLVRVTNRMLSRQR